MPTKLFVLMIVCFSSLFVLVGCDIDGSLLENVDTSDADADTDADTDGDTDSHPTTDSETEPDTMTDVETDPDTATDTANTCNFNGETYDVGASFVAADGCNSCICEMVDGTPQVSCTEAICDPCQALGESECTADDGCRVILGQKFNSSAWCREEPAFTECVSQDIDCGAAMTYALVDGECWMFSDTCLPQLWTYEAVGGDMGTVCGSSGAVWSTCTGSDTDSGTVLTCEYNGTVFEVGETIPDGECNTCSCYEVEGVAELGCTDIACK